MPTWVQGSIIVMVFLAILGLSFILSNSMELDQEGRDRLKVRAARYENLTESKVIDCRFWHHSIQCSALDRNGTPFQYVCFQNYCRLEDRR